VHPAITVPAGFVGSWTHTGALPGVRTALGPVALWTRELRKEPPVVNVPAPHVTILPTHTQKTRSIKVKRDADNRIEGIEVEKE